MKMEILQLLEHALPAGIDIEEIQNLASADAWETNPEWAAINALYAWGRLDTEDYLQRYPDVALAGVDPVAHFVRNGIYEERKINLLLNIQHNNYQVEKIKVSILVPVYNNSKYLRECFESIIKQTLKEIEIIILDDGSTDILSLKIMEEYAKKDKRIKLIKKKNTGYGHTMNVGISIAKGEFIGIVESDDYIDSKMYEMLYAYAKKHNVDIIKSNFATFTGEINSRKINKWELVDKIYTNKVIGDSEKPKLYSDNGFLAIWAGIYSKKFLIENSLNFAETPGASFQDIGFWFKTLALAKKQYFIQDYLYNCRRDNSNSSVHDSTKIWPVCDEYMRIKSFLRARAEICKFLYPLYIKRMYLSYKWTLNRVSQEMHERFYKRYFDDFNELKLSGNLDLTLFSDAQKKDINNILNNRKIQPKIACIYTAQLSDGGLERAACDLSFIFKKFGYEIVYILIYKVKISYNFYGEVISNDLENILLINLLKITDIIFDYKFKDLVNDDNIVKLCSTVYGYKYIATIHTEGERAKHYFNITNKYINGNLKSIRNVICVSEKAKKSFTNIYGNSPNIDVINNFIDFSTIDQLNNFSERPLINSYILCAVRLNSTYIKGIDILIPAFLESQASKNTFLVMAGSGKLDDNLLTLIKKHPRGNRVKLVGFVDLFRCGWLKFCNFYICTSRYEGLPLVVQEALACNTPVLTTKVGCTEQLITDGINGHFIKELTVQEVANCIDYMNNNYKMMANNCRDSIKHLDITNIENQYKNLLSTKKQIGFERPKISVIIPFYNSAQWINECLNSVLSQTMWEIEIICIDDGSIDDSAKIISQYNDTRIKYIYQDNSGSGIARNTGIMEAKGEFLAFLDSDDILPNNDSYKILYENAHKHNVVISGGNLAYLDPSGKIIENNLAVNTFRHNAIINYSDWQYDFGYITYIYDRNFIINNDILFPYYRRYQDPVFFVKAMICAKKFCVYDVVSYCARVRKNKKKWQWTKSMALDSLEACCKNLQIANKYNFNKLSNFTTEHADLFYDYISQHSEDTNIKLAIKKFITLCEADRNLINSKFVNIYK